MKIGVDTENREEYLLKILKEDIPVKEMEERIFKEIGERPIIDMDCGMEPGVSGKPESTL